MEKILKRGAKNNIPLSSSVDDSFEKYDKLIDEEWMPFH